MPGLCIFCVAPVTHSTREHIWPESLGGDDGMLLSAGKMCSRCNNYFGREVEGPALTSWPFEMMRAFGSIPTKKGRWASAQAVGGTIRGGPNGPELIPRLPGLMRRLEEGLDIRLTFLGEPTAATEICRLLVKMGLQLTSESGIDVATSERFRRARQFARAPTKGSTWWFAVDDSDWAKYLRRELSPEEDFTEVWTTELDEADNAEMVAARAYGIVLFCPLVEWLYLPPDLNRDSRPTRYFQVTV